jgi:hypothetical protein
LVFLSLNPHICCSNLVGYDLQQGSSEPVTNTQVDTAVEALQQNKEEKKVSCLFFLHSIYLLNGKLFRNMKPVAGSCWNPGRLFDSTCTWMWVIFYFIETFIYNYI